MKLATVTVVVAATLSAPVAPQAGAEGSEAPGAPLVFRSIVAGNYHTCAIRNGGLVKCWGRNTSGQLGLGDTAGRGDAPGEMGSELPVVHLGAGRTATALAAGGSHTCALLDDGEVKCWGGNGGGQLGLGDRASRGDGADEMGDDLPAVDLGSGRTAIAIAAGSFHTCAVLDNGQVKCWGLNGSGQLGLGDIARRGDGPGEMGDNLPAVNLGAGRTATAVTAGSSWGHFATFAIDKAHSCALLDNGALKCWGYNAIGQLGLGDTTSRGDGPGEMGDNLPAVDLGTGRTATAVAAGTVHTCAVLDDASLRCWGSGGPVGLSVTRGDGPGEMGDNLPVIDLGSGRTAAGVTVADTFTCFLLDDATVTCRGGSDLGQVPVGGADLGTGRSAVAVTAGGGDTVGDGDISIHDGGHACAVLDDGGIKCWGSNRYGELGAGDTANRGDQAGEMGDSLPAVDLSLGSPMRVVLSVDRHAVGAGDDIDYRLTITNLHVVPLTGIVVSDAAVPGCEQPVPDLGGGARYTVTCSHTTSAADGGASFVHRAIVSSDQAPATASNEIAVFIELAGRRQVVAVAAGREHGCALLQGGAVKCWGSNFAGKLGLGDTSDRGDQAGEMGDDLPVVELGSGRTAVAISAGWNHGCAVLDDGSVRCWGDNTHGQLGLGDTSDRGDQAGEMGDDLPVVDLGHGRTAVAISAGSFHTCAVLDNGAVKCWGDNASGKLGLGDTSDRGDHAGEMGDDLPAVDLGTGRTATAVSANYSHTCAVLDNGAVKCWGDNTLGQLGLGNTTSRGGGPGQMGDSLPAVALGAGRGAVAVAAGHQFTCVVLDNASAKCWGYNYVGQLGIGSTQTKGDQAGEMGDNLPALRLGTGRTVTSVRTGGHHACAVLDDATVKCWGQNTYGQLGRGDNFDRGTTTQSMGDNLLPTDLGTGRSATAVATGDSHTCALLDRGAVKCWGNNAQGRLGLGDSANRGDEPGEMGDYLRIVDLGPEPQSGSVAGTVAESGSGNPLGGELVAVLAAADLGFVAGQRSAPDGTFVVAVPAGDYHVLALDPGATHNPDWAGAATPALIHVAPGGAVTADLHLAPTRGVIAGTVTDELNHRPVTAGLFVALDAATGRPGRGGTTALDGTYAATYVPAGSHLGIFVDLTGAHTPEFHDDHPGLTGADPITVTAGATTAGVDAALTPRRAPGGTAHLAGQVTSSFGATALPAVAVVALHAATYKVAAGDLTDGSGHYDIALDPGDYKLEFYDPSAIHQMQWHPGLPYQAIANATTVTVTNGSPTITDATLTPAVASISGRIRDSATNDAISDAWVIAINDAGTVTTTAFTNGTGHYTLVFLPPGTYRLRAVDPTNAHIPRYYDHADDYAAAAPVTVAAGQSLTNRDAALDPRR